MLPPRFFAVLALSAAALAASDAPGDFSQERAMAHIRFLAGLKSRTAGTRGESRAIRYVREELRRAGVDAHTEAFRYSSYRLDRAALRVGGVTVEPARVVLDPYSGGGAMKGEAAFVAASAVNGESGVDGLDLARKVVVTTNRASYFRIAARQPAAIVFVSDSDFEKLKAAGAAHAELTAEGAVRRVKSANLVGAARGGKAGGEIILSAHIDSAGTPGAQDNASGVAVLLELARLLPRLDLPFRLRFVFFGAEEEGRLGSKAYLQRHRPELQACQLLFNMDSVGGKDIWIDMSGGVRNVPDFKGASRAPYFDRASSGSNGRWILLAPEPISMDASNVPPWLQAAIRESARELGYRINEGQGASSDHQTFTEAGIVATNIAIGGIASHSPKDVPEQINPASLEKAARIVAGVINRCRLLPR